MRYVLLSFFLLFATTAYAEPQAKPGDHIITTWACKDLDATKMLARSESVGQFNSRLLVFVGLKKCARFKPSRLIAKKHIHSFIGSFGAGEIWTIEIEDGPPIYAVLAHQTDPA